MSGGQAEPRQPNADSLDSSSQTSSNAPQLDEITPQIQPSKSTPAETKDKFCEISLPGEKSEENAFAALRMSMNIDKTSVALDVIQHQDVAMDWEDSSSSSGTKRAASKICDPLVDVVLPLLSRVFETDIDLNQLPLDKESSQSPFFYMDIISSVINDFAARISDTSSYFESYMASQSDSKESESWDAGKMEIFKGIDARSDKSALILFWLMCRYERYIKESKKTDKSAPEVPVSEILNEVRCQCIQYAILVTSNVLAVKEDRSIIDSVLLPFVLHQWHGDFILEMIQSSYKESKHEIEGSFRQVFEPLIHSLWHEQLRVNSFTASGYQRPLQALNNLVDITISGKKPFCQLLISLKNWIPECLTPQFGAVSMSKLSILGPFLSLSVFAEDDPKIVSTFYGTTTPTSIENTRLINMQLNKYLETARQEMFGKLKFNRSFLFN